MNDFEAAYLEAVNDFEAVVADHVPEVLPWDRLHDGWDGAAGAEIRDGGGYEPYPHVWDLTLTWCRLRHGSSSGVGMFGAMDVPVEDIPGHIVRQAMPYVQQQHLTRRNHHAS